MPVHRPDQRMLNDSVILISNSVIISTRFAPDFEMSGLKTCSLSGCYLMVELELLFYSSIHELGGDTTENVSYKMKHQFKANP